MKALNEERCVKRCISDFHDEPFCEKIIVIDGGSTDYTIQELKQFDKVKVYVHPWIDAYHYMEVIQSNILLSYIPENELMMIMDFDERMSPALKNKLNEIHNYQNMILEKGIAHFSRATHEVMRYEKSPHAIIGEDGWPIISHQIGQYPDYQCRLIRKHFHMHWVNSPHHVLCGWYQNINFDADIIHYEKDDYRDRIRIEKKWAREHARRMELGLNADMFDCAFKPEIADYYDPETWKK
jgi:glycosyltransferase involved in cell wall biosynthesis